MKKILFLLAFIPIVSSAQTKFGLYGGIGWEKHPNDQPVTFNPKWEPKLRLNHQFGLSFTHDFQNKFSIGWGFEYFEKNASYLRIFSDGERSWIHYDKLGSGISIKLGYQLGKENFKIVPKLGLLSSMIWEDYWSFQKYMLLTGIIGVDLKYDLGAIEVFSALEFRHDIDEVFTESEHDPNMFGPRISIGWRFLIGNTKAN